MEEEARDSREGGKTLFCRGCHAEVAASSGFSTCPACGGGLVVRNSIDSADLPSRAVDRRGILLPRRHAVGGIITPR